MTATDLAQVLAYHQRSKHHPGRYAASLGYLDWDTQPNPFRIYTDAPAIALPRTASPNPRWPDLFKKERENQGAVPPAPLDAALLDGLLLHSLALSAWKQSGASRWSLRVNPSSGNLHPTEAYLISPELPGLSAGLYHYSPLLHALERRTELPAEIWRTLTAGLPQPCLLVGLSSIAWREAWKYGERAFRYCQHDLGHAIAAIDLGAALHGWHALELPTPGDAQLAALLGLRHTDGPEPEIPEALLLLAPGDMSQRPASFATWTPPPAALEWFTRAELAGAPNQLSEAHHPWPVIDEITAATRRPDPAAAPPPALAPPSSPASAVPSPSASVVPSPSASAVTSPSSSASIVTSPSASASAVTSPSASASAVTSPASPASDTAKTSSPTSDAPASDSTSSPGAAPRAAALIRARRSAVAMDGRTGVTRAGFYDMLLRTCPEARPLRALPGPARVDLAIFVHRVEGLGPGLYLLLRDPARRELWRGLTDPGFAWTRPDGCPDALDLSLLRVGDGRQVAAAISCGQAIAADGAFALGMIADMRALADAPWLYRRLFWETGAIGQILYLEAEALGIAATGIGCFFDDRIHAMLGLQGPELQSLYHFTVGGRLEDDRLRTLDPYHHLETRK